MFGDVQGDLHGKNTKAEAEAALRRYVDVDIPKLYESLRDVENPELE